MFPVVCLTHLPLTWRPASEKLFGETRSAEIAGATSATGAPGQPTVIVCELIAFADPSQDAVWPV